MGFRGKKNLDPPTMSKDSVGLSQNQFFHFISISVAYAGPELYFLSMILILFKLVAKNFEQVIGL